MIWFVPTLVKIATRTVKSKGDIDEQYRLEYLNTGRISTPELSLLEVQKEMSKFGTLVQRMNGYTRSLLFEKESKPLNELLKTVRKYEEITDRIEKEVANFLAELAENEMSEGVSIRVRGMLGMAGDLERIGDIYYQISKTMERKIEAKIWFTPAQRQKLEKLIDKLEEALVIMNENLLMDPDLVDMEKAIKVEDQINRLRKKIRKEHYANVEKGDYSFANAAIYSDLFNSLEKVGDHVINVTEGIKGEV